MSLGNKTESQQIVTFYIFRKYEICVWLNPRSVLRLFAMVSCVTSFLSTAAVTIGMIKPVMDNGSPNIPKLLVLDLIRLNLKGLISSRFLE